MKVGSGDDALFDDNGEEDETPEDSEDEGEPDIPWIFTRENVKSGRDMVQFYLRGHVQDKEKEFVNLLRDELDTNVPVTDAREAAYLVAMDNPDDVAKKLEDWGFHLKE